MRREPMQGQNSQDILAEFQRQNRSPRHTQESIHLWNALILGLITWIVAALQASFLCYLPLFGAVIELTAALILWIGWRYGPIMGGALGVLGGFLLDALTPGGNLRILPILFFLFGCVAGLLSSRLFHRFWNFLLVSTLLLAMLSAVRAIEAWSLTHFFASLAGGVIAAAVVYGVGRVFARKK